MTRVTEIREGPENAPFDLSEDSFVVLDQRSIRESTCEVHYRYEYMPTPEGYDGAPPDWDEEKLVREYRVWRIKYRTAWHFLAGLWHIPQEVVQGLDTGGSRSTYVDEEGILQQAYVEEHDFDDLEDRAPYRRGAA